MEATEKPHHLIVGQAAWWIPAPAATLQTSIMDTVMVATPSEDTQKLSFAAALKDFLENLSFHCYGKLVEHARCIQERFFWLIFHTSALSVLIAFLWGTYKCETETLVTTMYDPLYPIWKVEFPAVSICSFNRISKRAILRYAEELSIKDPKHRNVSYFYDELQAFGYLYYTPDSPIDYYRAFRFQVFLNNYDTELHEMFYNTRRRMNTLTPNCSELFVSCRMAGRHFDCLEQFEETLTSHGFCCTFNYDGRYVNERSYRQRYFGAEMGLVVTLKTDPSDNFYKLHPSNSFPDPYSGGVAERFAQTGLNTLLPVRAKIFETVPEARSMSPTVRKCLFENEMPLVFARHYSFSKCISACRARSIIGLCECVPFSVPHRYYSGSEGRVYCTLEHMECLRRYEFKWLNVITSRANVTGLEHEMEDSLYCPDCLASCTETRYSVRGAMTLSLPAFYLDLADWNVGYKNTNKRRNFSSHLQSRSSSSYELAVVRIYFAETHIQYFRQIIKNAWYETFSTIGNICGIIAGFSLIGICELLFFLAKQLWLACKAELKAELRHVHNRANGRAKATQQQGADQVQDSSQSMELLILP
ncbi:uncharacterized protein Dwil_GK22758 [Drosophila willistoni]|uniref:Sodium channel protein Nach n=1 Tax=Drosophila willistoni TaxID=7260 RepID=B4NG29_DROWI|nr:sodium channel protein Nach [Drosophila willistoni]EDW83246.2 uncharacterized protein Dwil_GK22758 [Drosophila willistoni]